MKVDIVGTSHLAQTLQCAAELRGFEPAYPPDSISPIGFASLTIAAEDVLDHADLAAAKKVFDECLARPADSRGPVVLVSQVPPGTTRRWAAGAADVFYQVDTIIVARAVARARAPEQIVVGCADPAAPLPLAYQEYLAAHECPVLQMSYESAELAKCAINFMLTRQIEAANELQGAADAVGADYVDVVRVLRNDARIGPHAYLLPGAPNQHLKRDVGTIEQLLTLKTAAAARRA